jgi:hypothetical protein
MWDGREMMACVKLLQSGMTQHLTSNHRIAIGVFDRDQSQRSAKTEIIRN